MMRRLKGYPGVLNVLSDEETPEPALYVAMERCAGTLQATFQPLQRSTAMRLPSELD